MSTQLKQVTILNKPYLKVVKNSTKQKSVTANRIYINTLSPNFSYTNEKGEVITGNNCILL